MFTVTNTVSSILDRSNKINQGAQDQWSIDFNNRSALENLMVIMIAIITYFLNYF